MYRITLLLALCLCAATAGARDGFSLSASYGAGFSYQRHANPNTYSYGGQPWTFHAALAQKADLAISYHAGHWVVQAGIGYWQGGYTRTTPYPQFYSYPSSPAASPLTSNGTLGVSYPGQYLTTETFTYPQIVVPVLLGYEVRISNKFSVTPSLGVCVAHNLKSTMRYRQDTNEYTYHLTDNTFSTGYKRTGWWALAQADVLYQIASRWSVFCGPRFAWMLTPLAKGNNLNYEWSPFKLYNITFNAGISWRLAREKVVVKE